MKKASRLVRRWATLARLGGRTLVRATSLRARRLVASRRRKEELTTEFQLRSAEDVASTLGNLKGAVMKAGQLLSFVDDGMPEHIRTALAQLQDSAPPMSADLAAQVIERELGAAPTEVFKRW